MALTYGTEGADLRVPEVASNLLHYLLVDLTDLFKVGMVNLGDQAGRGSATENISQIDLDDAMSSPAEGGAVSVTEPATASVQVTIARKAIARAQTDILVGTGAPGMAMGPEHLAMDSRNAVSLTRTALAAGLFSGVSSTVGATTVDFDVDLAYDGMFALQTARNRPPFFACVYPEQLNNFQSSLRGEGGAAQFEAATAGLLHAKGPGYAGSWHGIEWYTSDQVPTANGGADSNGCMWAYGAFGFKEASIAPMLSQAGIVRSAVPEHAAAWIEEFRTAANGLTTYVTNYYVGVVELEDARAVGLISDR